MRDDINLIPKKQPIVSKKVLSIIILICLIGLSCIGFFGVYLPNQRKNKIETDIALKNQELQLYANVDEEYEKLMEQILELKNNNSIVEELSDNNKKFSEILKDLQASIPKAVTMNDLSYNDGVLTLNASTSNIIDVARFMVELRQLEYIQSVKFSSIDSKEVKESSEDSKDTFDFHLSVEFVNNETKDIEIKDQVEEGVD